LRAGSADDIPLIRPGSFPPVRLDPTQCLNQGETKMDLQATVNNIIAILIGLFTDLFNTILGPFSSLLGTPLL
jgi:hypothetical protein